MSDDLTVIFIGENSVRKYISSSSVQAAASAGQWKRMVVGFFGLLKYSPFEIIDLILLRKIQFVGRLDDFEKKARLLQAFFF